MKEIYTKKQLAKMYSRREVTVQKILKDINNDGIVSRWPAYTTDTFEKAVAVYNKTTADDLDNDNDTNKEQIESTGELSELVLAIKKEDLRKKKLDNEERENSLVSKATVDRYFQFLLRLFVSKIKELCKDKGDEYYNLTAEELFKDIESHINEEAIDHIMTKKDIKLAEKIFEEDSISYDV